MIGIISEILFLDKDIQFLPIEESSNSLTRFSSFGPAAIKYLPKCFLLSSSSNFIKLLIGQRFVGPLALGEIM